MSLAERVRVLRAKKGWNQGQLAAESGVDQTTISRIELGKVKDPHKDILVKLARAFAVTVDYLIEKDEQLPTVNLPPVARLVYLTPMDLMGVVWVRPAGIVSAGPGASEQTLLPYLPEPSERGHNFVWVEVVGDCLEPRVMAGHLAIVDTSASPRVGCIVAAKYDGGYIVKELRELDGKLYLVALQGQPPILVTPDVEILGVVVAAMYRT